MRLSRTLPSPCRVDRQCPSHRDQIHFVTRDHFDQLVDARDRRSVSAKRREHIRVQAHRTDGDHRLAAELLGPAGQVERGAFELRLPETSREAMEHIDGRAWGRRQLQQVPAARQEARAGAAETVGRPSLAQARMPSLTL